MRIGHNPFHAFGDSEEVIIVFTSNNIHDKIAKKEQQYLTKNELRVASEIDFTPCNLQFLIVYKKSCHPDRVLLINKLSLAGMFHFVWQPSCYSN
eukprot:m.132881 g.132881  ORF g.132881 m.132881 type:complete len:95 (+) comp14655_c0_seq3:1516-1800(+)